MTNKDLESYRIRLRIEQAAVLAELALRKEIDDWSTEGIQVAIFGETEPERPKP